MVKKVVTFGEVMLRLSTPGLQRFTQTVSLDVTYAGAEANVAVALRNFGIPATHVTAFPNNDLGVAAAQTLAQFGVDTSKIVFSDHRMGVYFLENGAVQRAPKIIYDRFDSAFAHVTKDQFDWKEILKDASWFHYTGITPAISQGAADACLEAVRVAASSGVAVSGDINYRRNLWQYGKTARDVMPALMEKTNLMIAGETDLENCAGLTGKNWEDASRKMMDQYKSVQRIVRTNRGSISASHNTISAVSISRTEVLKSKEYDITHIVDRVGTGDAFVAGLIYGDVNKMSHGDALEFATASCVWKHSVPGDHNLASAEEIYTLVKGENVGKLLR
ncbi:MAG TPA: sugar kinase [Chryseosolibacter sp.]